MIELRNLESEDFHRQWEPLIWQELGRNDSIKRKHQEGKLTPKKKKVLKQIAPIGSRYLIKILPKLQIENREENPNSRKLQKDVSDSAMNEWNYLKKRKDPHRFLELAIKSEKIPQLSFSHKGSRIKRKIF